MQNNQPEDVLVVLTNKINGLSPSLSECCIFRVHNHLREVNQRAYEPEVVSIGPYHRGKEKLQMMEDHKLRYLRSILQRKNEELAKYVSAMRSMEQEARKCYAEPIELSKEAFVEMLILDSCFVVELTRRYEMGHLQEEEDDIIFKMDWMISSLRRDLMMFENQLPFFVIRKMFGLIEEDMNNLHFLMYLALNFSFGSLHYSVAPQAQRGSESRIKHLLELVHDSIVHSYIRHHTSRAEEMYASLYMPCASKLIEAGIKFEKPEEGSLFNITFKNGVMSIPPLRIEDSTESFFRNLIAYEQYSDSNCCKIVTGYASFMDRLIDTSKDVEILSRWGIVDNWLGDDEAIANLFNKIVLVTVSSEPFYYADVCNQVNVYYNRRMNRWMAKLKRNYLSSPWAVISVVAAIMLLVLTFTQTVTSITMN